MGRHLLRDRRIELGMTREELARKVGCVPKTVTRWETGEHTPQVWQRHPLARALQWSLPELAVTLNGDGAEPPHGHTVPAWLDTHASLEQGASAIWAFQPLVVHALLQTRGYARAVEEAPDPIQPSEDEIVHHVELRLARQAVLHREPEPLQLSALLDEAALHRVAGGPDVMAEQLERLADMADLPNVGIRVIPFDAGVFSAAFGSFSLLASLGEHPNMAFVEDRTGVTYLNRGFEIDAHMELFEHLWDVALTPADSVQLIRRIVKEKYL